MSARPAATVSSDSLPPSEAADASERLAISMGLLPHEFAAITRGLGRLPSAAELAVFTGLWSEHCAYKSTRSLLATLPRSGAGLLAGPGHHAGVVDVGEGWAVAFKIESHNHPSAVEPYQGAATGVGGILRDVIAQGARPVALMDFLCFAEPDSPQVRRLRRGIVAGIADYGNSVGVPNVGGRTLYHPGYRGKPLVNALCAGLIRPEGLRVAAATGVGNVLLLVGAATGRDGVLGAAFASEVLGSPAENQARRSHVQVGNPFFGKLLMEAVLSLPPALGPIAVQDLGACGLACAVFEMAALGGVGMEVDLDAVPLREPDLSPLAIFLSESQERFALLVRPQDRAAACRHFEQHGLCAAAVAVVNDSGQVRVRHRGQVVMDLPAALVSGGAPPSRFAIAPPVLGEPTWPADAAAPHAPHGATLLSLLALLPDPEPIYTGFDQTVGNRTVRGPGAAACAVLRLPESGRGFALSLTGRGDLCAADPYLGAQAGLAEAVRRLACVGSQLLAVTDGLNFASPRDPQEYGRIARVIAGLGDGLRLLGVPVSGGNVSLYNQSPEGPIPPTPMIGGLGIVEHVERVPGYRLQAGQQVLLLGAIPDDPVASLYTRLRWGQDRGRPACDLPAEQRLADLLRQVVDRQLASALWPVTIGGLLTTLAKICARNSIGASLVLPLRPRPHWQLFGEYSAQVLVACAAPQVEILMALAQHQDIPVHALGEAGGTRLQVTGLIDLPIAELRAAMTHQAGEAGEAGAGPGAAHVS